MDFEEKVVRKSPMMKGTWTQTCRDLWNVTCHPPFLKKAPRLSPLRPTAFFFHVIASYRRYRVNPPFPRIMFVRHSTCENLLSSFDSFSRKRWRNFKNVWMRLVRGVWKNGVKSVFWKERYNVELKRKKEKEKKGRKMKGEVRYDTYLCMATVRVLTELDWFWRRIIACYFRTYTLVLSRALSSADIFDNRTVWTWVVYSTAWCITLTL